MTEPGAGSGASRRARAAGLRRDERRRRLTSGLAEGAVLLAFFSFYLLSFDLESPVNGPQEVFAQDSTYILKNLDQGRPYPWNPQNHLLYHVVVERVHAVWSSAGGTGMESTYRYLKLFTALCGLAFLAGMRWLFRELGLMLRERILLLLLAGVTVSAWFHFAAFETHCLAMPALALYLVAAARLRNCPTRTAADRVLLIGSLAVCGWTRVDLFYWTAVSALWLLLPSVRRNGRSLVADLALASLLFVAGNAGLAHAYFGMPMREAGTYVLTRKDRSDLREQLGRAGNLEPHHLIVVGRAVSLYSLMMPVDTQPAERGFFAPPTYKLNLYCSGECTLPSTTLFLEPARKLLGTALTLVTLAGIAFALLWAVALSLRRIVAGDPFHAVLVAQALAGWLLYTWFNPLEPFLWVAEFMPLWVAMIADHARWRGRVTWTLLALLALCLGIHNWFAFYVPFR